MALEQDTNEDTNTENNPRSLIRCLGRLEDGSKCNAVLWEAHATGIRLRIRVRAGEHIELNIAAPALASLSMKCARCETRWRPADPWHPLPGSRLLGNGILKPISVAAA